MRKVIFLFAIILIATSVLYGQDNFQKAVSKYFKVNPLNRKFSVFLTQVMKDSLFVIDALNKRTDTSLFYLRGHYKTFNPFIFKTNFVQLLISEEEMIDTVRKKADTILSCEIIGITDSTNVKENQSAVQTQFKFFQRKYGSGYLSAVNDDLKNGEETVGEVRHHYATFPLFIPALSCFWGEIKGGKSFAFSVVVRLKIKENMAALPVASNGF